MKKNFVLAKCYACRGPLIAEYVLKPVPQRGKSCLRPGLIRLIDINN
ncbi:hypothetical protein [Otoolea muris]|nr:hypothetical protein [Otoolea muris]